MGAQGMDWDVLYILQISKPRTLQELATQVHDMEMMIANHCGRAPSTSKEKKDKGDFKNNSKSSKSLTKEPMLVFTIEPI